MSVLVGWLCAAPECDDAFDFGVCDVCALDADGFCGVGGHVEHVAASKELFGAVHVKDDA